MGNPALHGERRNSSPRCRRQREHPLTLALAGVPGLFLAGYAAVNAMVQPRPGRGGGHNPESCLGVVLSGRPPRVAPEVLAAAGLGLIGPVIWSSREAV